MGLTSFEGKEPKLKDVIIAKNDYFNNLVLIHCNHDCSSSCNQKRNEIEIA